MSAMPVLAALLRAALPGVSVLDLGWPAGRVFPCWPGARLGVAAPEELVPAEAALLRRFRQGRAGTPLFGLGEGDDAALLAGAPAALGDSGPVLIVLDGPAPERIGPLLQAGAMVLRGASVAGGPLPPGPERGRIMLLGGSAAHIERWELLNHVHFERHGFRGPASLSVVEMNRSSTYP